MEENKNIAQPEVPVTNGAPSAGNPQNTPYDQNAFQPGVPTYNQPTAPRPEYRPPYGQPEYGAPAGNRYGNPYPGNPYNAPVPPRPVYPNQPIPVPAKKRRPALGFNIVALILGIIGCISGASALDDAIKYITGSSYLSYYADFGSILSSCIGAVFFVLLSIVFGILGIRKKENAGKGVGTAGLVLACAGLITAIAGLILITNDSSYLLRTAYEF